jgi:beta-propeller repeat-containing protein/HYDIN/CFA65/VesB family protein
MNSYGKLPLTFEANVGQVRDQAEWEGESQVKFLSRGDGYTLFLTASEAVLALRRENSEGGSQELKGKYESLLARRSAPVIDVLRLKLVGANSAPRVSGLDELPGKANYFLGNNPKKWLTQVPAYASVKWRDIYPGIDLVYYGSRRHLESDFIVSPGANPSAIRLEIQGGKRIELDSKGTLVLEAQGGEIRLHKPVVYQWSGNTGSGAMDGRSRHFIEAHYVLRGSKRVGFDLAPYNPAEPLVIDPLLSYSTYLGGQGADLASAIVIDSAGNAYVTGYTLSTDFPTTAGALQTIPAGGASYGDAFVTKLNSTGSSVVYSTYLGGSNDDLSTGIAVDSNGSAYVTGYTRSSNFPTTPGSFRARLGGGTCGQSPSVFPCGDAFVAKLSPGGNALVYSTYLGGGQDDWGFGIATDSSTNAYVTGYTESTDFPTTSGAFEATSSGGICGADPCPEAFVTKLNANGSALIYSTYLGGMGGRGYAIAVDGSGSAYVTGSTDSTSFPTTPGALQTVAGQNGDGFVVKLKPDGSGPTYSTYLGGMGGDLGTALALDSAGNAYVAGATDSFDFPTTAGAFQTACRSCANGLHDAFVTKLNAAGSALLYSTFLGGKGDDLAYAIAVDSAGNAYVAGRTLSSDFPTSSPFQSACGGGCSGGLSDAFVTRINAAGSGLIYSTFLGGSGNDAAYGIALDSSANAYVTGSTGSGNFPTTIGAFQTNLGGIVDAFVAKLDPPDGAVASLSSASLAFPDQVVGTTSSPQTAVLQNLGNMPLAIDGISAQGDFAETHTCGTSVAPGASCTMSVTFAPTTAGIRTGAIAISDNSLGGPQAIILSGNGIALAVATLSTTKLSFPDLGVGSTSGIEQATLTNTGWAPLLITSLAVTGDFGETNTCGASLAPGASCSISVTFTPTALGVRTGTVTPTDNASGSPQVLALSGNGVGGFALQPSSNSAVVIRGTDLTKFSLFASSSSGFTGSISLACSGNGPTHFAFNPTSLLVGQTSILTVSNLKALTGNSLSFTVTGSSGHESASLVLAVSLADFSLSASPSVLTLPAGETATLTLSLTPVAGFSGALSLACSGAPPASSCSFSPTAVSLDWPNSSKATVTVTTTARSLAGRCPRMPLRLFLTAPICSLGLLSFLAMAFAACFLSPPASQETEVRFLWRSRAGPGFMLGAILFFLATTTVGCAGGGSSGAAPGPSGTPAGTYTLTLTATYTNTSVVPPLDLAHSTPITLTVN